MSSEDPRHDRSDGGLSLAVALILGLLALVGIGAALFLVAVPSAPVATTFVAPPPGPPPAAEKPPAEPTKEAPAAAKGEAKALEVLHWDGLHNVVNYAPGLYSGNAPETPEAFATLAKQGIKTVVSVDGAPPKVELAKAAGLAYVHIPTTYATITPSQREQLARVARERPKPIYLHCHHGKHRGPAAAAILWRCSDAACTAEQSLALLKAAGTDPKYKGLYKVVAEYAPPPAAAVDPAAPPLPESVPAPALVEAMIELDGVWDRWKARQTAGWPGDAAQATDAALREAAPDAVLLREQYEEMLRLPDVAARPEAFRKQLSAGFAAAKALEDPLVSKEPLTTESRKSLQESLSGVAKSCSACHAAFRDTVAAPSP